MATTVRLQEKPEPLTLDEIVARLERDRDRHVTQPCTAAELDAVEERLGRCLPAPLRTLLMRVGAGIFYDRHEIMGARRVMIHNIELVPDLLSAQHFLRQGESWPERYLGFHRTAGQVHAFDLDRPDSDAVICPGDPAARYPDLPTFLAAVVLGRANRSRTTNRWRSSGVS